MEDHRAAGEPLAAHATGRNALGPETAGLRCFGLTRNRYASQGSKHVNSAKP